MEPRWVEMSLDVDRFDGGRFAGTVEACLRRGIAFTSMSALGDDEANRRRLYDLNRTCSADIPERGPFFTYDEWRAQRIDAVGYDPASVILALDGEAWVGMSAASDHRHDGYFFNEMTGVIRSHRRQGIATALKVLLVERARGCGVARIDTFHHPGNRAPIELNRRLGYVERTTRPTT